MDNDYTNFYQQIGKRIFEIRSSKGISQADLAEKTGLSLPAISSIENGKSKTWLISFAKIAEALDVSADDILKINTTSKNTVSYDIQELLNGCTEEEQQLFVRLIKDVKDIVKHSK